MAVNTVALTDGGRVDWWLGQDPQNGFEIHAQKYDATGQAVGPEYATNTAQDQPNGVYALNNGGFIVAATRLTMDGESLQADIFGANATLVKSVTGGADWHLATSSDGGFLVGSVATQHHGSVIPDSTLALYDSTGALVGYAYVSAQAGPQVSVDADGGFHASWTDYGGNAHALAVDAQATAFTRPPAPSDVQFVDDVGPNTGVLSGGPTNDALPVVRVPVSQTGWVAYEFAHTTSFNTAPTASNPVQFVAVTASDVARGYAEIPVTSPLPDGDYALAARFENADGIVGPQYSVPVRVDTHSDGATTITKAIDDVGAHQGEVADGGTTDDTTPVLQVSLAGSGAQPFDKVLVFDNGHQINIAWLDQVSVQQGFVNIGLPLSQGSHSITTQISDFAGNIGAASAAFRLTVGPDPSGATAGQSISETSGNQALVGGAGDDTITAHQGGDTLTGNGGADHFAFASAPWSASEVTDFTPGADKIDLSGLLSASHYTGSDPIADGYVKLIADGHGDTWLYFDTDGRGSGDPWGGFVATLDHVAPSAVTSGDLVGPTASPPPPSGGQTLHGQAGGSNLVGGSGDDTLIGGTGADTLTGGGGADHFAWSQLPWSAAKVTDFVHGTDKIDVSGLLVNVHYAGADPIADGYVKLIDDGHGDTWLYFDTDGRGSADQWGTFVATLNGVSPTSLSASDFMFH
jgi:Ca2+-binding RTX toxin-like protein